MRRLTATGFLVVLLGLVSATVAGEAPRPDGIPGLTLSLDLPKVCALGQRMSFTLRLESARDQEVATLDTAVVEYTLARRSADGSRMLLHAHHLHDNTRVIVEKTPGGRELAMRIKVEPRTVALPKGKRLERHLVLQDVFAKFSEPGDYVLTVRYQDTPPAQASFRIVLEYSASVPALIGLIERGDLATRGWARNMLWIVTGQPDWRPSKDDAPATVKARIAALRAWWQREKTLYERINRIYMPQRRNLPKPPPERKPAGG
ncbi:hypothetical protein ACFL09_03075 [Planctomycetota bacterium]